MRSLFLLPLVAAAVNAACNEMCTEEFEPVCASNGLTFPNRCVLEREACLTKSPLTVQSEGRCPLECPSEGSISCTYNYDPVCGNNGETFTNPCSMLAALCDHANLQEEGLTVLHMGRCVPACAEVCTANYDPVCGSDGVTYANDCLLGREACLTKREITVKGKGECAPECPEICTDEFAPVCGSNGQTYTNECDLRARACSEKSGVTLAHAGECVEGCAEDCAEVYLPVCGSDGVTYSNGCFLKREACLAKKEITVRAEGPCGEECPEICPETFEPVCASDGHTYGNECKMHVEACRLKGQLAVSYAGECRRPFDCPEQCTKEYRPVCGSNGRTYGNLCSLQLSACQEDNAALIFSHDGECHPACPELCTSQHSPVCGSNGRTYGNPCFLSMEACRQKTDISILHEGSCVEEDCPMCTKEYRPVCGSDDRTYGNPCELNAQACREKSDSLRVAHEGECHPQDGPSPACPEICPNVYEPVCGSDWRTYPSHCALSAEACRLKTPIQALFEMACSEVPCNIKCPKDLRPVCGSDGQTYSNPCMMELASCQKRRVLAKAHDGECQPQDCDLICPMIFDPVCGTNRETFSSLCHFDSASCRAQLKAAALGLAHAGECAELRPDMEVTWEILREFDRNDDQLISVPEFLALAAVVYPHQSEGLNAKVFSALDVNQDGQLTQEEAKALNADLVHQTSSQGDGERHVGIVASFAALLGLAAILVVVLVISLKKKQSPQAKGFAPVEDEQPYRQM